MMSVHYIFSLCLLATCTTHVTSGTSNEMMSFTPAPQPGMYNSSNPLGVPDVDDNLPMTSGEYELLHTGLARGRNKRKALRDLGTRWRDGIVYYQIMDSILDESSKYEIKEAMAEWSKYTCLEFRESSTSESRIQFQDSSGCHSQLGMQSKPQVLGLASGCRAKGIVIHEIGHALGLIHEHNRPDRDSFIKVNFQYIPERFRSTYKKFEASEVNMYGVPYDYMSIMHMGSQLIPNSIITLDPFYQNRIGQRIGLAFNDIKLVNLMYDCARTFGCENLRCPRDGLQLYKNYKSKGRCQCWCDSGNLKDPLILCSDPKSPRIPDPRPVRPTEEAKATSEKVKVTNEEGKGTTQAVRAATTEKSKATTEEAKDTFRCEDLIEICQQIRYREECKAKMAQMREGSLSITDMYCMALLDFITLF